METGTILVLSPDNRQFLGTLKRMQVYERLGWGLGFRV